MNNNNTFEHFLSEISGGKKLIIFGGGNEMQKCMETMLEPNHIMPAYIVDNDFRKWYSKCWGYEIKEPKCLLDEEKNDYVVLITSIYPLRIENQLKNMGIENYYSSLLFLDRHLGKQQFIVML